MSRELVLKTIVLKKTPYLEADEIITVLSLEAGKLRFLAKSVKSPKSKLQNSLQGFFLCDLRVAGFKSSKLPKIIGAQAEQTFSCLRENLAALKCAFSAVELVLKFLPDEQPHQNIFKLLKIFLNFLDQKNISEEELETGLVAFKIKFLEGVGLGVVYPEEVLSQTLYFDNQSGGFVTASKLGVPVPSKVLEAFLSLKFASFKDLPLGLPNLKDLSGVINMFTEYQLERELKAEKSLSGVV